MSNPDSHWSLTRHIHKPRQDLVVANKNTQATLTSRLVRIVMRALFGVVRGHVLDHLLHAGVRLHLLLLHAPGGAGRFLVMQHARAFRLRPPAPDRGLLRETVSETILRLH